MGSETGASGRRLTIESEDGDFEAYVARPAGGAGPGVIVLQEWWGLVPQIEGVCDRLARAGFVALAPDLYRGESTTDPDQAGRLMMALEIDRAGRDLALAVDALRRQPETTTARIGCIGFCMGGQLALHAACQNPEIAAVVDCYGVHPNVALDLTQCKARVLAIFAEHDEFISPADVKLLEEALDDSGVEATVRTVAGVQHAFLNEARADVHDAARAHETWRDIETFLTAELR